MKGLYSPRKFSLCILIATCFFATNLHAQKFKKTVSPMNAASNFSTSNSQIWANVDGSSGLVTIYLPPGRSFDPQLDFYDHSYFTCQIGSTYFTNNATIALPASAKPLDDGNTIKTGDTIRTTWLNKNGVDIIQDIYPVLFAKSGQIIYSWRFFNHNGSPVNVGCQYLQDIQISDPSDKKAPNSNDGPIVLTKWSYKPVWQQYPNSNNGQGVPSFFIGFLHDLPNAKNYFPNLSGQGYLDFPAAPMKLIKPFRLTIGDWYIMTQTIFGTSNTWPIGAPYGTPPTDNALLLEFPAQGVGAGKTIEVGRTSYGTGEFGTCIGDLFSLVFYPTHLVWTKSNTPPPGFYTPNPIHIEKFVVNEPAPANLLTASNTKITLTVGDDMTLVDTFCSRPIGKSQTLPKLGPGASLAPGDVAYFDWWICTSPALYCNGPDIDTLVFTGSSSFGPPTFLNNQGVAECDQLITIDCAETDVDPPLFSDTVYDCHSASLTVSDSRPTDRGLNSITWKPATGTVAVNFLISDPVPPISPCVYGATTDKAKHTVTITKIDSTLGGCFDFTMTDCLGHQSYTTVCLKGCPLVNPHPDSLPPVFTLIKKYGTYDSTLLCDNNRIDSFEVSDLRKNDSGICSISVIAGSSSNMALNVVPFTPGSSIARFTVKVLDSMHDGNICIRATDCSKAAHYTDTCFHYCTIPDKLCPRITITKDPKFAGLWSVEVKDDAPWDRHIDSVYILNPVNVLPKFVAVKVGGSPVYVFTMTSPDTTQKSSFCITAIDSAGNKCDTVCAFQGVGRDSLSPNIIMAPPPSTNPTSITVDVNDIHFTDPPANTIKYVWDTGVDSVWFTNNTGMNVPAPISGKGAMTIPQFTISVIDPNAVGTISCVTIHTRDRKGNPTDTTYCYLIVPDVVPPIIKLWYNPLLADRSQIFGIITDSTLEDRGLDSITLIHATPGIDTNLKFKQIQLTGAKIQVIDASNAITRDPSRSSVGTLLALDRWGSLSNAPASLAHTATVDFAIWRQDFAMKPGVQPSQGSSFYIPVYFVKNDSFRVSRKDITDFKLTFTMTGDVNSVVFDSASQIGTEMEVANWNRGNPMNRPTWGPPNSSTITVIGTMLPSGKPLASLPLEPLPLGSRQQDSIVLLYFHALNDQSTRQVNIIIDSLILNQGRDTLYKGTSSGSFTSTALMPAPYGSVGGATIVITGACAPRLTSDNLHPTSVSLDPNHPNPFSRQTTFNYTVAQDGPVRIAIHDILGREITRIVDQYQKQGTYSVIYDGSSLSGGTYVARLQSGGVVVSRRVAVEK